MFLNSNIYKIGVISLVFCLGVIILLPDASALIDDNLYKFDTGFYEHIQTQIPADVSGESNSTIPKQYALINVVNGSENQLKEILVDNGAENIFVSTGLDFVSADIPVNRIAELAEYDFVYKLGDEPELIPQGLTMSQAKALVGSSNIPSNSYSYTGQGVTVAVIDVGVDFSHPDLRNKKAGKVNCGNTTPCPPGNHIHDHGTALAAIIAANSSNNLRNGIAPNSQIYDILQDATAENTRSKLRLSIAFDHMYSNNLSLSMSSLGAAGMCDNYSSLTIVIDKAVERGIFFSSPVGNTNNQGFVFKSCGFNSIVVGSVDNNRNHFPLSVQGPAIFNTPGGDTGRIKPEITAIGVNLDTATVVRDGQPNYKVQTGTSYANAFVAGASALIKEKQSDYSSLEIKSALLLGADWKANVSATANDYDNRVDEVYGAMNKYGFGVLNIAKSLDFSNDDRFPNILTGKKTDSPSYRIYAEQGEQVKILLSWFIHPRGTISSPDLPFDAPFAPISSHIHNYDLQVRLPDGSTMSSTSTAQNNEFIVFEAPSTGVYAITVSSSGPLTVEEEPFVLASTHGIDKHPFNNDLVPDTPVTQPPLNAPRITNIPDTIHAETTGLRTTVSYTNPTVDRGSISCDPASGSSFDVGTTTVTCTAIYDGATSTATFDVIVRRDGGGGGGPSTRTVISIASFPANLTSGDTVTLDASGTTGGTNLAFDWRQSTSNSPEVRLEDRYASVTTFKVPYSTTTQDVSLEFTLVVTGGRAATMAISVPVTLIPQPPITVPPRDTTPGFAETILLDEQWDSKNGNWTIDREWRIHKTSSPLPVDTNNKTIRITECDDSCPIQIRDDVELYMYDGADLTFWVRYSGDIGNSDSLDVEAAMVQFRTIGSWQDKYMIMVGESEHGQWLPVTINFDEFEGDNFFFRFVPMIQDEGIIELDAIKLIAKKMDEIKPVFSNIPDDINRTASGPSVISYVPPTAHDNIDGDVPVICDLSSGIVFPIDTTTVTCTATDSALNVATVSFDVILSRDTRDDTPDMPIQDTTPPVISGMSRAIALDLQGSTVPNPVQPTATDIVDGTITSVCDPAPGAALGLGTHTMTCTATDASGNVATRQGVIHVSSDNTAIHAVGDTGTAIIGPTYIHLAFDPVYDKTGYKCIKWTDGNYAGRTLDFVDGTLCSHVGLEPGKTYAVNVVPKGPGERAIFPYTELTVPRSGGFATITDDFADIDGWSRFATDYQFPNPPVFSPTHNLILSQDGNPAPSAEINGQRPHAIAGVTKTFPLVNYMSGDPLYLYIDYRASSNTNQRHYTNAVMDIDYNGSPNPLFYWLQFGGTNDTGWRTFSTGNIAPHLPAGHRTITVNMWYITTDQDVNQRVRIDNLYIDTAPRPSGGASGGAEPDYGVPYGALELLSAQDATILCGLTEYEPLGARAKQYIQDNGIQC